MNTSAEDGLMTLLEAMLALAAREARRPKPPPVKPGGFPEEQFIDLAEEEKEELECGICYQILKETMQCTNNHKFCHSCLLVWSTTGQYANRIRCPVCRTQGYYFRNSELDDKIGEKMVKCHLETCKWSGKCKQLLSHRHTTYGDDSSKPGSAAAAGGGDRGGATSTTPSMPRLSQASPQVPRQPGARFVGTGLTTRDLRSHAESLREGGAGRASGTPRGLMLSRSTNAATPSSLSSTSQETVVEIPPAGGASGGSRPTMASSRGVVPPVRSSANNRIVFNHSRPPGGLNAAAGGGAGVVVRPSGVTNSDSDETMTFSVAPLQGGFTPRPPSAPRNASNVVNTRRLPRISNPPPTSQQRQQQQATAAAAVRRSQQQPTSSESSGQQAAAGGLRTGENLGEIRDRLQESRNRLDNLMSSFSGELDRSRLEMAEFQQERERQRREQLDEVRELGQRLGQVASELRRLLEHRRNLPHHTGLSDTDSDEDLM